MSYIIRNNVKYAGGSGSGDNAIECTMAEYKAFEAQGKVIPNTTYYITDENVGNDVNLDASNVIYDDTNTQLGTNTVQKAIESLVSKSGNKVILTEEEYNSLAMCTWKCGYCGTEVESVEEPTSCPVVVCTGHNPENDQNWILKEDSVIDKNKIYHVINANGKHDADSIIYDDTETQLGVDNVQDAIGKLNSNIANVNVYVGEDSKLHFVDSEGADSVIPFSSGFATLTALFQHYYTQNQNKTYTATKDCTVLAISLQTTHGGDGSGGYKSTLTTTGEMLSSNKYRKGAYMDGTYRAVDMDIALIKLTNGNKINMVTPACGNACTVMQVFELS